MTTKTGRELTESEGAFALEEALDALAEVDGILAEKREEMTATVVKVDPLPGSMGSMILFRLDPPLQEESWDNKGVVLSYEYVIVSAAVVPFSGPETYLFPSNDAGEITDWGELSGSQKGTVSHRQVLEDLGYKVFGLGDDEGK